MSISDFDRAHVGDIVAGHGTWFTAKLLLSRATEELRACADYLETRAA